MSAERKYVRLSSWADALWMGEDPGRRPDLTDELLAPPSASLPPTSTRVNAVTSLRPPDPEAQRQARAAHVDTLLALHGIRPRRR